MVFTLAPFLVHYVIDFYGVYPIPAILLALAAAALIGLVNGLINGDAEGAVVRGHAGHAVHHQRHHADDLARLPAADPGAAKGIESWFGRADWAELIWALVIVGYFHVVLTRTAGGCTPSRSAATRWRHGGRHPGRPHQDRQLHDSRACSARFAGILEAFRIQSIDPNIGRHRDHVHRVAAAVIGGTALAGGSGTVVGAFSARWSSRCCSNGFNLIGISANPFNLILGRRSSSR
jgi:simple sugar transport system permease protein